MIAIVIHRFGKEIVGGAERYAYDLATILSEFTDVEVLTTTAKDHFTWRNYYNPGVYFESNFVLRRFPVDFERSNQWHHLHNFLLHIDPSIPLCEEWIKCQGPYSGELFDFLARSSYNKVIFVTYLYPTTYYGVDLVKNPLIVPTYHDEPPFYFPIFRKYSSIPHLFLTEQERDLALSVVAPKDYALLGFGLKEWSSCPKKGEYFLYVGRLEASKGVNELARMYEPYYERTSIPLYCLGTGTPPKAKGVVYIGEVSDEEKFRYIKGAKALLHPSPNESLGIVLFEAFSQKTPAIVTAKSDVLSQHIKRSGGGLIYRDIEELHKALDAVRPYYGERGYRYYKERYDYEAFVHKVYHTIIGENGWIRNDSFSTI